MKKLINIAVFLMLAFSAKAQTDTAGTVFTSQDYRNASSNAIAIKWIGFDVYYPEGCNVYRQEMGTSNWTKLNESPIVRSSTAPADLQRKDPDIKTFLDNVNQMDYAEFKQNIMRVFVVIKTIKSPDFAALMGVIHYDETAQVGASYRYQVKALSNGKEQIINTSKYITAGTYVAPAPPKAVTMDRKKKVVEIKWDYEDERYYGVNIYRSTNGRQYEKITPQERHLQKTPGKDGIPAFPEIFFEDTDIKKDEVYSYKLTCIDYFGQESGFSPDVKMPIVDFEAPPAPTGLKGEVHFKEVKLEWTPQLVDDLAGFNVYRHHHAGEAKIKLNAVLLSRVTVNYSDQLTETGNYYYSVSAVDVAGNETVSGDIMVDIHDIFPPAIPQNVVIVADSGEFRLQWDPVADSDLAGYFVYRALTDENNEDNEFIVMNTTPIIGTTYIDKLPKKIRNKFVYTVVSMDTSFNHSEHSKLSVVKLPDVTPPQAPFIRNIHTEPGKIRIDWLPNHETDMKAYQVYRSSALDSANYQLLGSVEPTANNSFKDETPHPGTEYYYFLKAIDQSGNVSSHSNIYEGLVFDDSDGYIEKELNELSVKEVKAKYNRKKKQIELSWQNADTPELLGIVIYRGISKNDLEPLTGLQKINSYTDTDLKGSNQYIYQFRVYDVNGHKVISKNYPVTISN